MNNDQQPSKGYRIKSSRSLSKGTKPNLPTGPTVSQSQHFNPGNSQKGRIPIGKLQISFPQAGYVQMNSPLPHLNSARRYQPFREPPKDTKDKTRSLSRDVKIEKDNPKYKLESKYGHLLKSIGGFHKNVNAQAKAIMKGAPVIKIQKPKEYSIKLKLPTTKDADEKLMKINRSILKRKTNQDGRASEDVLTPKRNLLAVNLDNYNKEKRASKFIPRIIKFTEPRIPTEPDCASESSSFHSR
jgi:ribosomal protein L11